MDIRSTQIARLNDAKIELGFKKSQLLDLAHTLPAGFARGQVITAKELVEQAMTALELAIQERLAQ